MNLRALETLVRIARVGSFSAAAEEANMTLSAVSMQIKALEGELNVQIFDRAMRPPQLTPLGREVVAQAERVLREQAGLQRLCAPQNGLTGMFRIGVIQSAAVRFVPGILQQAARLAPAARFDFATGLSASMCADVLSGYLDAAIVTCVGTEDPMLGFSTLARDRLVLAFPAAIGATELSTVTRQVPFLRFNPGSGIGQIVTRTLRARGVALGESLTLDSIEAIMECVRQGSGFTILPEPDVSRHADPEVRIAPLEGEPVIRELSCVMRRGVQAHDWQVQLRDVLKAAIG
jgi:DNA-binding transcriptional LysR family regulator